jgi:hypothetical protein
LTKTGITRLLTDKLQIKIAYRLAHKTKLDLDNPQRYSEKIQWLKLYDRNPYYTKMVDKYLVKDYVIGIIGSEYVIPLIGVYDNFNDIDFSKLPNQFVLKTTHDSGSVVICRDKESFDFSKAREKLTKSLKRNFYYLTREWPYKNVSPRIIIEKYIEFNGELTDYKFFCFNGVPKALYVATDRFNEFSETRFDFFDMNFNHLPIVNGHPNSDHAIERPLLFEKMKELSRILSKNLPHVRIDFYEVNSKIYFGEFTFYHMNGLAKFEPEEWDYTFGEWLTLPKDKTF